jgi:hypothetical protein
MNPLEPLSPDLVDELLSAELDGEFDAAARDHGFAPVIARELLDEVPGVDERRARLAAARVALTVDPPSDDMRASWLAAATAAAPADEVAARRNAPHSRGRVARAFAVAAAIVVVAGLAIGVTVATLRANNKNSSGDSSSAAAASPTSNREEAGSANASPSIIDFGVVADAAALRAGVERALSTGTATDRPLALSDNSADAQSQQRKGVEVPAATTPATCVAKQATALGIDTAPAIEGPAMYAGQPVQVLVFTRGNQAFVVAVADPQATCRLVASQLLRTGN